MLKLILFILAAIAAFLAYAATKPNAFRYQRSIRIHATPEKIMPYLVNQKLGKVWSPWDKKDPAKKETFSGPEAGVGSVMEWEGNREVGKGRAEIIEVTPTRVLTKLDFERPMVAHNEAEYLLKPEGDATEVTWSMYGSQPFFGKVFGIFIDCEKMVGGEFEKGLMDLKKTVESH